MSRMLRFALVCTLVATLAAILVIVPVAARQALTAKAAIVGGDGISGTITLREVPARSGAGDPKFPTGSQGVEITIEVKGLKPGTHGIHIHAIGKCEAPAFTSAGGHFDPGPNGMMDPDANHPFHMGDLPNLVADDRGAATWKATTTRVTLGAGPLSLFDEDGSAIVIHGNPDQGLTAESKAGLSGGPRAACGVIVK